MTISSTVHWDKGPDCGHPNQAFGKETIRETAVSHRSDYN